MANEAVRVSAKRAGVRLWEVADYCGMADSSRSLCLASFTATHNTELQRK